LIYIISQIDSTLLPFRNLSRKRDINLDENV